MILRGIQIWTLLGFLFSSVVSAEDAAEAARDIWGVEAVCMANSSLSGSNTLSLSLENVEFQCNCYVMPQPKDIYDFSQIKGGLFSDEEEQEKEDILNHKSYLTLSQKGGGSTLEDKRHICRLFTRLAGGLMKREDAVGVFIPASEDLMISRRVYVSYASDLEKYLEVPEYFPAPLWVGIVHCFSAGRPVICTTGLRQFGFLELAFLEPASDWTEVHPKLYLMSIYQITGKDLYKDKDTIVFPDGNKCVFKVELGILYIMGVD